MHGRDGTISSPTAVYTLGWWHHPIPQSALPHSTTINPAVFSLSMIWADQFQHFVFDTLSRVAFSLDFLQRHPHVKILHNGGVTEAFLVELGIDPERLVLARDDTMYR